MSVQVLTGNDTIKINERVLSNLGTGDVGTLAFPNELAGVKTGKNGNSIYVLNETGKQADVTIRVIRGSSDDKFLQGLLNSQSRDFNSFILMTGEFIKKLGDGAGNITNDIYLTSGGVFTKQVEAKINVEGDVEQALSVYTLRFASAPRALT